MTVVKRRQMAMFLAVTLVASGCSFGGNNRGRPMELSVISGSARLTHKGAAKTVSRDTSVSVGDSIVLSSGGIGELRLKKGRIFELDSARVQITSRESLLLSRGKLLADLTEPAKIDAETSSITAKSGTLRVDRFLATRIGTYAGSTVRVTNGVSTLTVPRYRQTVVAGGIVPRAAKPLRLEASDRWDQRLLQDVLDLDARLGNFGRGLEAQLGSLTGLNFFGRVLPGLELTFLDPFLSGRRSDLLIGLVIASGGSSSLGASLSDRFDRGYGLWSQGASWGLIAHEFEVEHAGLFAALLAAIERVGIRLLGTGPRAPGAGPPGVGSTPSPGSTASPSGNPTSPTPGPGRSTAPVPSPVESILPDPIEEIIDGIYGSLNPPLP